MDHCRNYILEKNTVKKINGGEQLHLLDHCIVTSNNGISYKKTFLK